MEKLQENREFSSKDVLGVFASLGFLLLVAMGAFRYASVDYQIQGAHKEMVKLSRQLITHGAPDVSPELRGPASLEALGSEGKISKDPWGNPYQYKLLEKNSKLYAVAIWSKGPNQSQELSDKNFLRAESGRVFRLLRAGDDLTHIEIFH